MHCYVVSYLWGNIEDENPTNDVLWQVKEYLTWDIPNMTNFDK